MKKTNAFRRVLSAVCSICILISGLAIPALAAEIDGGNVYGWTGVSLAKQPGIPFSMDFNKSYEGSLGIAAEDTAISDVVKITNSSGNVAYAAPLDYTLKGENDGVVKMTYTNVGGTDPKNKNEIWILNNASAVTDAHSIEFDLYLDGDYSAVGFQERNIFTGWSNEAVDGFKKGWQKVAVALTDSTYSVFVDGTVIKSGTRKINTSNSVFFRMWVSVTEAGKSATVAIDNLNIRMGAYYTNVAVIDSTTEDFSFNDNSTSVRIYNVGNVTSKVVNGANNFAQVDYTLKGNNDGVARVDFSYANTALADLRGTVRLTDSTIADDFTIEFELYADSGADSVGVLGNKIVGYDASWLKSFNNYIVRNQWNDVALSFSGDNAYLYVNGTKVSETAANSRTDGGWLRLGVVFAAAGTDAARTATIAVDNLKSYTGAYTGETYATQAVIDSTSEDFGFNDNSTSVYLFDDNGYVTSKVVKNGKNFAVIDYTLKENNDGVARVDFSYANTASADLRGTVRLTDSTIADDFTMEFELYADSGADSVGILGNKIVGYDAAWLKSFNSYIVRNQWNDVALSFSGDNAYLYVNGTKVSETAANSRTNGGWLRLGVVFAAADTDTARTATIALDNLKAYEGAYTGEIIVPEFTSADGGLRVIPSYGGVVIDEEYTVKEVNDIISAAYVDYTITVFNANGEVAANDKLAVYGDYVNFTKGTFTRNYSITNGKLSEINFENNTAGETAGLLTDTQHVNDIDAGSNFTKLNVNGANTVAKAGYESNVGGKEGISAYVELSGVPASSNATLNGNVRPMLDSMPRTSDHNLINIDRLNSSALTLDYTMQYKVYATGDIDGIDLLSRQYYQGDGTKKTYLDIVKLGFGENDTWVSRLTDDDIDNDYIGVSLEKNKWYDIALAFDLSECTFDLYIDGDYKATGSVGKSIYDNLNGIMSMALKPIFNEGSDMESRTGRFYWDDGQTYYGGYKAVKASSPVVDETAKTVSLSAYADAAYPQNGVVIVACYNDGKLEAVKSGNVSTIKGDTTVSVNYEGDFASYDEVKLMFWESMATLKPYISFDLK